MLELEPLSRKNLTERRLFQHPLVMRHFLAPREDARGVADIRGYLPLLRKLSSIFLSHLLRFCCCGGFRLLIPLSNLFCSSGPKPNLAYTDQRGGWKLTKLNHTGLYAYEEARSSFHHNRILLSRRLLAALHVFNHIIVVPPFTLLFRSEVVLL